MYLLLLLLLLLSLLDYYYVLLPFKRNKPNFRIIQKWQDFAKVSHNQTLLLYTENGAFSFRLMTCFAICIQRKLREIDF